MRKVPIIFLTILICFVYQLTIDAQIKLTNYVVGNGGVVISNNSHILSVTIGQPIIGRTSNTLNTSNMGFWHQYAESITGVEENLILEIPREFELFQNYPNPFNPTTIIRYGLPKESNVKVIVYNILGEIVNTLVNTIQKTGYYEVNFNASNLASGVYIYVIQSKAIDASKDFRSVKKMILLR